MFNFVGRCCCVGQRKSTRFYVIWVAGEPQDEASRVANKERMSEAEALTKIKTHSTSEN